MSIESNLGNIAMKKARIAVDIGGTSSRVRSEIGIDLGVS
jgi:hypothetical protein